MRFYYRHSDVRFSLNKAHALTISKFDSRRTGAKKNAIAGHEADMEERMPKEAHELDAYRNFDDDDGSNASDESKEDPVDIAVLTRAYVSKENIVKAVDRYHAQVMRPFKVAKSDKHRYNVVCPVGGCTFFAQFAFTSPFDRPPNLSPYSRGLKFSAQAVKRLSTAKYLIDQKHVSPATIQRKAQKLGLSASYMNCVTALKRLVREFYGDDRSQYPCLPSCIAGLNGRGHRACCGAVDGTFVRLAVVYREGIQAFSQYTDRGLSIDGTFLKTVIGGTLLVACFRNGNLQLQIVGIVVVSGENQANWDLFLRFLVSNLDAHPRFLILDRDKGVIPAVAALYTIKIHFFCFRHLVENFNRQFKSKPLKNAAILKRMNPEAEAWLMGVGKDKWSLLQSMSSIWRVDLKQCRVCERRAEENPEASYSRLSYGY